MLTSHFTDCLALKFTTLRLTTARFIVQISFIPVVEVMKAVTHSRSVVNLSPRLSCTWIEMDIIRLPHHLFTLKCAVFRIVWCFEQVSIVVLKA